MLKVKSFFLISLIFLFLTWQLFSQTILQGTVKGNGGEYLGNGAEPVVNALVTVTDQADTTLSYRAYTDEQGYYKIQITGTSIDDILTQNPGAFKLFHNYPNPFNPSTVIAYELRKPAYIRINIYNILGQKIKTVFDGFQNELIGHFIWDATDYLGQDVSAGLYIYSLETEGTRINKKMLFLDGLLGHVNTTPSRSKKTKLSRQIVLNNQMSDQYRLRITGDNILTYEQHNLKITGNTTLDVTVIRTVTDIDGNIYRTVKIGNQWWMAENLRVTKYSNGDTIPHVTDNIQWSNWPQLIDTGAYCNYNNDINNVTTYGHLYNWFAINNRRNIAPVGWHVPTDDEWKELEMNLGMSQSQAYDVGVRGTDEGGKLKETGTTHWTSPNTGATNESGFTALPGGWRSSRGIYQDIGNTTSFWTSTGYGSNDAWYRSLSNRHSCIVREVFGMENGFPVRCVKD